MADPSVGGRDLRWLQLRPTSLDVAHLPGPRDSMVVGRTVPYNSLFLWGGEDNALTFGTAWEFVFEPSAAPPPPPHQDLGKGNVPLPTAQDGGRWFLLDIKPGAPQPASRATPCSAMTDANEVFLFSGRPLETPTRGPLGHPLDDLWSFNGTCPKVEVVYQPADPALFAAPPPAAYADPLEASAAMFAAAAAAGANQVQAGAPP